MSDIGNTDYFAEIREILHDQGSSESTTQREGLAAACRLLKRLIDLNMSDSNEYAIAESIVSALNDWDFQLAVKVIQSA